MFKDYEYILVIVGFVTFCIVMIVIALTDV